MNTRSYAALRAADLDWIVGPGYSSGRYILEKNHEKPWRTNLEPWKTMKTDLEPWKTNQEPWKTNQEPWKTNLEPLKPWKPNPNHEKPT